MKTDRRLLAGTGLVALGIALVAIGWFVHDTYGASVLLELGVTVLLLVPLLYAERLFERRIEASEERTRREVETVERAVDDVSDLLEKTRRSVDDLRAETRAKLKDSAEADRDLVVRARANVSFENVWRLFERAGDLGALSGRGVRVVVPGQWERVLFSVASSDGDEPRLLLDVEDAHGVAIGVGANWRPRMSAADALVELAESWKRAGSYPSDSAIDAGRIFDRLLLSLETVIEGRRTRGDTQLDPLIEMIAETWLMTEFGLEHVPDYYPIKRSELAAEEGLTRWRQHMREKIWVEEESKTAREKGDPDFWMVSEVAHYFFKGNTP